MLELIIVVAVLLAAYKGFVDLWDAFNDNRRRREQERRAARRASRTAGPQHAPHAAQASRSAFVDDGTVIYFADNPHNLPDNEYRFRFAEVSDGWRAYIIRMPDLHGRESAGTVTHRLYDGNKPYVCWNQAISTLEEMQDVTRLWANSIQEYIATGREFG